MALALVLSIIAVAGIWFFFYRNTEGEVKMDRYSCETNQDCVADSCCHATGCVNSASAPICGGKVCTLECKAGTMDCGEKICSCINKKCEAINSSK